MFIDHYFTVLIIIIIYHLNGFVAANFTCVCCSNVHTVQPLQDAWRTHVQSPVNGCACGAAKGRLCGIPRQILYAERACRKPWLHGGRHGGHWCATASSRRLPVPGQRISLAGARLRQGVRRGVMGAPRGQLNLKDTHKKPRCAGLYSYIYTS